MTLTVGPVVFDKLAQDVSTAVAEIFAHARETHLPEKITYRQLVEETGISRAHLDKMFKAQAEVSVEEFVRLCQALELDPRAVMSEAWRRALERDR